MLRQLCDSVIASRGFFLGPYIDSASWALLGQLAASRIATFRISGSFLFSAKASAHEMGTGLFLSLGGAAAGGAAVYLAGKKKTAQLKSRIRKTIEAEHEHFLAAAEGSMDAFYILDSLRDESGQIRDFTFRYLNPHAEQRLKATREDVLGTSYRKQMELIVSEDQFQPLLRGCNHRRSPPYRVSGEAPGREDHMVASPDSKAGVTGIAVTSSDLTEFKSVQDRFKKVTEFSDIIFDNAPFSIIATDADGKITAVNLEAETLTGYRSEELVNRASLLLLHDAEELKQQATQIQAEYGFRVDGFDVIAGPPDGWKYGMAGYEGATQEAQWTFIRRDGTRISVSSRRQSAARSRWHQNGTHRNRLRRDRTAAGSNQPRCSRESRCPYRIDRLQPS